MKHGVRQNPGGADIPLCQGATYSSTRMDGRVRPPMADRNVCPTGILRRWCVRSIAVAAIGILPVFATAQTKTPLLEQLSQETQAVHERVSMSLVHLHLPQPANPAGQIEELFRKWDKQLDPAVKQKLQEQLSVRPGSGASDEDVFSLLKSGELGSGVVLVRPFDADDLSEQSLRLLMVPRARREAPRTAVVILDNRGLVLVPAYIDRELAGDKPLKVRLAGGEQVDAAFVGSDRQTNVTLLRLAEPAGTAAELADTKPADGALVLVFSPHTDRVQLSVWTGGASENGIVVTTAGRIAGFANGGQFLSAPAAGPIVQQLAAYGRVKRAVLGVRVTEVRPDDPLRQRLAALGTQPAMRVERVSPESPADKSGLQSGDLILSVAGESVGDLPTFAAAIAARQGETEMRVLRDRAVITVKVELAPQ
jgi:S1-C subfamily serine protease